MMPPRCVCVGLTIGLIFGGSLPQELRAEESPAMELKAVAEPSKAEPCQCGIFAGTSEQKIRAALDGQLWASPLKQSQC
jgi:hypothetical protein